MKKLAYFATGLGAFLLITSSASAQTKEQVVQAWQQHLNSLTSLQFDYEATITRQENLIEPFRANEPLTWKYKFALSGDKYYSYAELPSPKEKGVFTMTASYDGEFYRSLDDWNGTLTAAKWRKQNDFQHPYLGGHPLTALYSFAFQPKAVMSLETLRKAENWDTLLTRISAVRPLAANEGKGALVTVKVPQSKRLYEVFVDEKTLLPYQWLFVTLDGRPEKELEVTSFIAPEKLGSVASFPAEIITLEIRNKKAIESVHFKIAPEGLKINEPIPQELFAIPRDNVTFVDADEQEKIFLERKKAQATKPPLAPQ